MREFWSALIVGALILPATAFAEESPAQAPATVTAEGTAGAPEMTPMVKPRTPAQMAVKSATAWLSMIDREEYGWSWQNASSYFRNAITAEQWIQSLAHMRSPLQAMASRVLISNTATTSLPGVPDGEYYVLIFETSFVMKRKAQETVTVMRDTDGSWRVAGYFIK